MAYNPSAIQQLIDTSISAETFIRYCYDDRQEVYPQFSSRTSSQERCRLLVQYCRENRHLAPLLKWIQKIAPQQYVENEPRLRASAENQQKLCQILVVDDEQSWQNRYQRILREINCRIMAAHTFEEAEAFLSSTELNLAIIDLNLDGSHSQYPEGLELVQTIRRILGEKFPIIIVSGTGTLKRQRLAFKKYRVFDFLEKAEFDFAQFLQIVREAITRSSK